MIVEGLMIYKSYFGYVIRFNFKDHQHETWLQFVLNEEENKLYPFMFDIWPYNE